MTIFLPLQAQVPPELEWVVSVSNGFSYHLFANKTWACNEVREDELWLVEKPGAPVSQPTFWLQMPVPGVSLILFYWHPEKQVWLFRITAPAEFITRYNANPIYPPGDKAVN